MEKKNEETRECETCKGGYTKPRNVSRPRWRKSKFCSRKCQGAAKQTKRTCVQCAKSLVGLKGIKYCSSRCQKDLEFNKRAAIVEKTGDVSDGWSMKSSRCARHYIIRLKGYKCSICGIREWQGQGVPLVMDHENGNPEDHRVSNLRMVCGNCDMQLPTYKNKNKGKGRAWRKKYYVPA